jgi:MoaA/NifB/PqqE/SkfB family radical SAM enzyme
MKLKMTKSKIKISYIPEIKSVLFGRIKPSMVSINLTNKCNQNCIYCEIGKDKLDVDDDLINSKDLIWIIDQMALEGIDRLSMCGGEPFLFQGLVDIVKYAWSKKVRSNITSNGMTIYKLTDHEIKTLSDCNCHINISVDSFNPEIQSKTRGNHQALENAIRSIEILQKNKINVTVLSAISKYNYTDLFSSFKSAYQLGVKELLYQPIISVSNYPDKEKNDKKEELNVPVSDIAELNYQLEEILTFERRNNIKTNVYRIIPWISEYIKSVWQNDSKPFYLNILNRFYCREAYAVIDISYYGGIQSCGLASAERSIKNRNNQRLIELWHDATTNFKKQLENENFPEICNGCCHKFSRNMLASVLKFPVSNRRAAVIIFTLLLKRVVNRFIKRIN